MPLSPLQISRRACGAEMHEADDRYKTHTYDRAAIAKTKKKSLAQS
jgi:hypothetical protein